MSDSRDEPSPRWSARTTPRWTAGAGGQGCAHMYRLVWLVDSLLRW